MINFNDLPSDIMIRIMNINKDAEKHEAYMNKEKHKLIINELNNNIDQLKIHNQLFDFDWGKEFKVSLEILRVTRDNTQIFLLKQNGQWFTDSDEEDDY
jgi:hypothetical protein